MIDMLVRDGTVTLIALAVLALELVCLPLLVRGTAARLPFAANALSGLFLILALRAAILGHETIMIALWLGLGFLAHVGDIVLRLRRPDAPLADRRAPAVGRTP